MVSVEEMIKRTKENAKTILNNASNILYGTDIAIGRSLNLEDLDKLAGIDLVFFIPASLSKIIVTVIVTIIPTFLIIPSIPIVEFSFLSLIALNIPNITSKTIKIHNICIDLLFASISNIFSIIRTFSIIL